MLGNYLKMAVRALLAQKLYTLINLAGLSVGLACFILIMIFVRYEFSYERFFDKAERIYRISQTIHLTDGRPDLRLAANSPQVGPLLTADFPMVEQAARLRPWFATISRDGEPQGFANVMIADSAIFQIFDFAWLQGNPDGALVEPDSLVITASAARRHFGTEAALGQSLLLGTTPMRVVGVIADLPRNTHLDFDMVAPISLAPAAFTTNALTNWTWRNYHTYVLLAEGSTMADLEAQFPAFVARHFEAGATSSYSLAADALTDLHLHSTRQFELGPSGSMATVNAFIAIAFLVLLVACMNFMNLATVRAVRRAREVGMRKVLGGLKSHIALQFLGEAMLLTAVAVLVIAPVLVELALPAFGALLQRDLSFSLFDNVVALPFLAALALCVGLLSSAYPALYLSAYNPALVLKGIVTRGKGAAMFRNALVVLQFSVAVALLIATATIHTQLNFIRSSDPGYDREWIVVLDNTGREGVGRQWDLLKQELRNGPDVLAVTASNIIPTQQVTAGYNFNHEGGTETRSMSLMLIDYGYFETYGIDPVAGRLFSEEYSQDGRRAFIADTPQSSGTYILSELAAAQLGWTPEEALGKWIEITCCNFGRGLVTGVVEDVHFGSLRNAATPVMYMIPPEPAMFASQETRLGLRQASIRIGGARVQDTLAHIEASWKKIRPEQPLSMHFMDEDFNRLYLDEERQGSMLASFAIMAVFITCMGLYGLATYNAQRRTKEVGVRKVLGGSVRSIIWLLTNDFSKLVLLSNLIAWPLAWYAMNRWLENFAYRIDLTPLIFIGSGLIALCIAWVTVGGTAAKAASQKPVLALRYE